MAKEGLTDRYVRYEKFGEGVRDNPEKPKGKSMSFELSLRIIKRFGKKDANLIQHILIQNARRYPLMIPQLLKWIKPLILLRHFEFNQ